MTLPVTGQRAGGSTRPLCLVDSLPCPLLLEPPSRSTNIHSLHLCSTAPSSARAVYRGIADFGTPVRTARTLHPSSSLSPPGYSDVSLELDHVKFRLVGRAKSTGRRESGQRRCTRQRRGCGSERFVHSIVGSGIAGQRHRSGQGWQCLSSSACFLPCNSRCPCLVPVPKPQLAFPCSGRLTRPAGCVSARPEMERQPSAVRYFGWHGC